MSLTSSRWGACGAAATIMATSRRAATSLITAAACCHAAAEFHTLRVVAGAIDDEAVERASLGGKQGEPTQRHRQFEALGRYQRQRHAHVVHVEAQPLRSRVQQQITSLISACNSATASAASAACAADVLRFRAKASTADSRHSHNWAGRVSAGCETPHVVHGLRRDTHIGLAGEEHAHMSGIGLARARATTGRPYPGICRSVTTTANGGPADSAANASSPLPAVTALMRPRNCHWSAVRMSQSSSTKSTRGLTVEGDAH